ncbi:protein tyrosine phosphatase domain-containing protein 1 [Ambystoma mexicanum]|uniref:protein tyrosine phosphatase domain-containing protein 1 n=1 Tax=Ambystoma mexicanum TaxID=8296 RepID=UPI0037E9BED4
MTTEDWTQNERPYRSFVRGSGHLAAMTSGNARRPTSKYTKVGERLRHVIPGHMQCSMTCGGRACKYENPTRWSEQEQAIRGLYSSWITENILGMARPSTEILEKYNIIAQFQSCGIKTVINLQRPGEHASCGNPLEQESGFTYLPEAFMEAEIYFYNFGWKDYGVASLTTILDMVKVMTFALQEGKVAIHCHAGLGRTGVLIACYLIFATRMTADQAILFVRAKRPNAIQTRVQLLCVREFSQFLIPLRNVFSCCEPKAHAVTLTQYLIRQRHLLHGYEARYLKHVPKLVHLVCKLLLDMAENRQVIEEVLEMPDLSAEIEKTVSQLTSSQLVKELDARIDTVTGLCQSAGPAEPCMAHDAVLTSEQEFDPLWKRRNVECLQPLSHLKKRLSYSDSDLTRAEFLLEQGETPWTVPAQIPFLRSLKQQNSVKLCFVSGIAEEIEQTPPADLHRESSVHSPFSFWTQSRFNSMDGQREGSPLFHRRKAPKEIQRSRTFSLGFSSIFSSSDSEQANFDFFSGVMQNEMTKIVELQTNANNDMKKQDHDFCEKVITLQGNDADTYMPECYVRKDFHERTDASDHECRDTFEGIPHVVLQSESNLGAKRLLAVKALSGISEFTEENEVKEKVNTWQKELNSREGAWDKICAEKDPFILCRLMWSWIEQLKEPLITKEDVEMLAANCNEPQSALYLLEKGQHQTILCILHCIVSLQTIPADIEDAFFTRAIKAFTKVHFDSETGPHVYGTLKTIFQHVLEAKRKEALEKSAHS